MEVQQSWAPPFCFITFLKHSVKQYQLSRLNFQKSMNYLHLRHSFDQHVVCRQWSWPGGMEAITFVASKKNQAWVLGMSVHSHNDFFWTSCNQFCALSLIAVLNICNLCKTTIFVPVGYTSHGRAGKTSSLKPFSCIWKHT